MLAVGSLDTPNMPSKFPDKTGSVPHGDDDPTKRKSLGDGCPVRGTDQTCWLDLDPAQAVVCIGHIAKMLRTVPVFHLLDDNGSQSTDGKSRQRVRASGNHARRKRNVGAGQVPGISDASTERSEDVIDMAGENTTFGQEQFWKLLSGIEYMSERQRELLEAGKHRDEKLDHLLDDMRTQAEQFREFRREITIRMDQSDARVKLVETKLESMAAQMVGVTQQVTSVQTQVNQVQTEFARLKPAMEELIALKARVYAILLAFGAIFSLVLLYGDKLATIFSHISFK